MYMWRSLYRKCRTKVELWDRCLHWLDCIIHETGRVDNDLGCETKRMVALGR